MNLTKDYSESIGRFGGMHRPTKGFTLVELMVALALGIFLTGGVVLMFSANKAASLDAEQLARMQENIRFASGLMIRDIRNAGFRDDVVLEVADWANIGSDFATVGAQGEAQSLDIKYGGRGTCVEEFDVEKLVVNRYFLRDGSLFCVGVNSDNPAQPLVSGLTDLRFDIICPNVEPGCTCDLKEDADDPDACIGVRIRMTFEGPRDGAGSRAPRDMLLTAAFRNPILEDIARDSAPGTP